MIGRLAGLALMVVLLAGCSSEPEVQPRPNDVGYDPVEVVEAWWDARNSGNYDRMASLMQGEEAFGNAFGSRSEMEAAQLLQRVVTPVSCKVNAELGSLGTFVACDVTVTDIIVGAAGTSSGNLNDSTFRVRDGYLVAVPVWIPSSQVAEKAIERWAAKHAWLSYALACPFGIAGQSSIDGKKCAGFIARHEHQWRDAVASLNPG